MSRDESLERDVDMKDETLKLERSEAVLSSSGVLLEPPSSDRMEVASTSSLLLSGNSIVEHYHRLRHTSSTEPTEACLPLSVHQLPSVEQQREILDATKAVEAAVAEISVLSDGGARDVSTNH